MKSNPKAKKKSGLREIASAANVSIATVSRVLNGNIRVDPAIQKKVLAAAAGLNIDPSQRNKTKALAFLVSNRAMMHPFHSRILLGAEAHCAANGWDLVFLSHHYQPNVPWKELHLPKVVQRQDVVRGLILAGTTSANLLEFLENKGITYVVLGNNIVGEPGPLKNDVVFSDETQGGHDMTQYLISLGHRHISFVGNTRLPWYARAYAGYSRAMEEAGMEPHQSSIDSEDDSEIGYLGAKSLLASGRPVTAIFAGNDPVAHSVYKGLRDSGLRIPEDVSVAGCNDTVAPWLYPSLTTIREFPDQLGRHMAGLLLSRIADPGLPPRTITIPTELIRRDSCHRVDASQQAPTSQPMDTATVS